MEREPGEALLEGVSVSTSPDAAVARTAFWYDDLSVGQHFRSTQPILLTQADIIAFARRFDPKPGHTDPAAAGNGFFRGLSASGWHTAAVTQRLVADAGFPLDQSVGVAVSLTWDTPARPGDLLVVDLEVLSMRLSRSKPDRGVVDVVYRTLNQTGEVRQVAKVTILLFRDPERLAG